MLGQRKRHALFQQRLEIGFYCIGGFAIIDFFTGDIDREGRQMLSSLYGSSMVAFVQE